MMNSVMQLCWSMPIGKILPDAMNAAELTQRRGLHDIRDHDWYIQVACATMIIGMYEGKSNHC